MTQQTLLLGSASAAALAGALLVVAPAKLRPLHRRPPRDLRGVPVRVGLGMLAGVVAAAGAGLAVRHLALLAVLGAAALGVLRIVQRSRRDRVAHARRQHVVDYCEELAGELRAGQPVTVAVARAARVWPETEPVAAAARLDASVPTALRRLARLPGATAMARLAGAWQLSAGTGAGLVVSVEQVLATARSEATTTRLVRAELASARATARLVTALPVVVLLAAEGVGARPWHFLLATWPGTACLATGVGLSLAGLGWIDRIAAASLEGDG